MTPKTRLTTRSQFGPPSQAPDPGFLEHIGGRRFGTVGGVRVDPAFQLRDPILELEIMIPLVSRTILKTSISSLRIPPLQLRNILIGMDIFLEIRFGILVYDPFPVTHPCSPCTLMRGWSRIYIHDTWTPVTMVREDDWKSYGFSRIRGRNDREVRIRVQSRSQTISESKERKRGF